MRRTPGYPESMHCYEPFLTVSAPYAAAVVRPQTATSAKAPKLPLDAEPAQAPTYVRPRTAIRHSDAQPATCPPAQRARVFVSVERSPPNVRRPPAVPGTASPHACRYLDSRRAPTPHLRTPHAGAARTHPHPACTQKVPGNKVFRIWQVGAWDSGNKIAAIAHVMGSGGLAVDAMAIGCLGVERRVERFFSY